MIAYNKHFIFLISILFFLLTPFKNSKTLAEETIEFPQDSTEYKKDYLNNNKYILGPGDVLELEILGQPELSRKLNILIDELYNQHLEVKIPSLHLFHRTLSFH